VPTTYALNRALPESAIEHFVANSKAASAVVDAKAAGYNVLGNPRPAVTNYVALHQINEGTYPSLAVLMRDIANQVTQYGSLAKIPAEAVGNTRNDMYLASEAVRNLMKDKESDLNAQEVATLNAYKGSLDSATKFIPTWVKIAVAIALDRRHGRGEDRQDPPDLRAGRLRRNHRSRHHRGRRRLRPASLDHARALIGHCRNHGRQWIRTAMVDDPQHRAGVGTDLAGGHDDLGFPPLGLRSGALGGVARRCCRWRRTGENRPACESGQAP
jgi:hypothetical protein